MHFFRPQVRPWQFQASLHNYRCGKRGVNGAAYKDPGGANTGCGKAEASPGIGLPPVKIGVELLDAIVADAVAEYRF